MQGVFTLHDFVSPSYQDMSVFQNVTDMKKSNDGK